MPEDKRDVKALLTDAIRKRDELNTFIKVLQEMLGASSESLNVSLTEDLSLREAAQGEIGDPMSAVYPGMFFGKTQPQAAKLLLERVKRPLKTRIIVECLEKGGLKVGGKKPAINLWGILDRGRDTFILVPKAGWGLIEWYDAAVIAKMRKGKPVDDEAASDK